MRQRRMETRNPGPQPQPANPCSRVNPERMTSGLPYIYVCVCIYTYTYIYI